MSPLKKKKEAKNMLIFKQLTNVYKFLSSLLFCTLIIFIIVHQRSSMVRLQTVSLLLASFHCGHSLIYEYIHTLDNNVVFNIIKLPVCRWRTSVLEISICVKCVHFSHVLVISCTRMLRESFPVV